MPVRALRRYNLYTFPGLLIYCQNPINARKGITTPMQPSLQPVPLHSSLVRILLMPVRALRLERFLTFLDGELAGQNPINARKGITTNEFFIVQSITD